MPAVAFLPERLRMVLKTAEFDLDAVKPLWGDLGYIVPAKEGDGRVRETQQHRMDGGTRPRLYVFHPKHLTLAADDPGQGDAS